MHRVEADEIPETIRRGGMPPWFYVMMHPQAQLSSSEQEALIRGMIASGVGASEGREHEQGN
jgi:cytochrome c551/c552